MFDASLLGESRDQLASRLDATDILARWARLVPAVACQGRIGTVARGLIFALAGGLFIDAAVMRDATKASGLDGALRTLAGQPYGKGLLLVAAAGLLVFGCYGYAEARWHKT